jgi:hypothetical protein
MGTDAYIKCLDSLLCVNYRKSGGGWRDGREAERATTASRKVLVCC